MKRILMVTVATIILLWSTTPITAFASALQTRTFRTNLVKGKYMYKEVLEPEEPEDSVDEVPIDVVGEITTDPVEIAEPQESDEQSEISTPPDIEPAVDEEAGELEELNEPTPSEEPDETIEEYIGETEEGNEEEHETEVQSTQ